jgi:hypothetical protein
MKRCPRRVSLAMARDYTKEARATIAVAKAIVCLSMEVRRLFDRNGRSDGVRVQHRVDGAALRTKVDSLFLGTADQNGLNR